MMYFFSSLCSISLFVSVLTKDYCFEELCKDRSPHIACGHTGDFADDCPDDATLFYIRPYKSKILRALNDKRNALALGKVKGLSPAVRMATMVWDDDLAALAAMNVKGCQLMYDCHHTETYLYSGQCIYKKSSTRERNPATQVIGGIDYWWDEHKHCTMDSINIFPAVAPKIELFTCLASEMNTAVGCAMATYSSTDVYQILLTCNFAHCNVIGKPIYTSGPAGSNCTTGVNPKYHGLCSEDEEFELNF